METAGLKWDGGKGEREEEIFDTVEMTHTYGQLYRSYQILVTGTRPKNTKSPTEWNLKQFVSPSQI